MTYMRKNIAVNKPYNYLYKELDVQNKQNISHGNDNRWSRHVLETLNRLTRWDALRLSRAMVFAGWPKPKIKSIGMIGETMSNSAIG